MTGHKFVVVGASAGGVEALSQLVSHLPAWLPASIFIVLHIAEHRPSLLADILDRKGGLPAIQAVDGQKIEISKIYVAPPGVHMRIDGDLIRLTRTPRENGHRPSIDPLFRSAALHHGSSVIGVILSGMQDDGTAGLIAISKRGGLTIAQDPNEAQFPSMPQSAIDRDHIAMILPIQEIATQVVRLAVEVISKESLDNPRLETPTANEPCSDASVDAPHPRPNDAITDISPLQTCPECQGALWEFLDKAPQFECRLGHTFSATTLLAGQTDALEAALWTALRAVEDSAALSRRLQLTAGKDSRGTTADQFGNRADELERHAGTVREVLTRNKIRYPGVGGLDEVDEPPRHVDPVES